jgi:hypothetical protein
MCCNLNRVEDLSVRGKRVLVRAKVRAKEQVRGTTTGTGGESAMGEKGGKVITGRLMKGTVAQSEEGGGGKAEFSILGLLMRLGMLAAAVSLVCAGYLLERRRHNSKQ